MAQSVTVRREEGAVSHRPRNEGKGQAADTCKGGRQLPGERSIESGAEYKEAGYLKCEKQCNSQ